MTTTYDPNEYGYGHDTSPSHLPALDPLAPFMVVVHPARWEADVESGRLLPDLTILRAVPGVNGSEHIHDLGPLRRVYVDRGGWTEIADTELGRVDGAPPSFVRRVDVPGGKVAHICAWQSPTPGSSFLRVDRDLYRRFREHVAEHVAPQPGPRELEKGWQRARKTHARMVAKAAKGDTIAAEDRDLWAKRVAIWKEALDVATGRAAPKATRKPRASKGDDQ